MAIAKRPSVVKLSDVQKAMLASRDDNVMRDLTAFIDGAPDSKQVTRTQKKDTEKRNTKLGKKWRLKGNKVIITHSIAPEDLVKLDELARAHGKTRTAFVNDLIRAAFMREEFGP